MKALVCGPKTQPGRDSHPEWRQHTRSVSALHWHAGNDAGGRLHPRWEAAHPAAKGDAWELGKLPRSSRRRSWANDSVVATRQRDVWDGRKINSPFASEKGFPQPLLGLDNPCPLPPLLLGRRFMPPIQFTKEVKQSHGGGTFLFLSSSFDLQSKRILFIFKMYGFGCTKLD